MATKERRTGGTRRGTASRGTDVRDVAGALTTPSAILCMLLTLSKVAGAALSFMVLMSGVPEPLFLAIALTVSAVALMFLQQPWHSKDKRPLSQSKLRRVALGGAAQAAMLVAWMAGLRASGPARAFLVEGAELPLLYLFAVLTTRDVPNRKKNRGALLMLLGYLLLIYDASGRVNHHLEKLRHTRAGHRAELFKNATQHRIQRGLHNLHHGKAVPPMEHPDKEALDSLHRQLDDSKKNSTILTKPRPEDLPLADKPKPADDDAIPHGNGRRRLLAAHDEVDYDATEEYDDYTDYENYEDDYNYDDHSETEDGDESEQEEGNEGASHVEAEEPPKEVHESRRNVAQHEHSHSDKLAGILKDHANEHPSKVKRTILHAIFVSRALRSELGIVLLLLTAVINQSSRGFSRRVATEVGGAKRYFAIATTFSAIFMIPPAFISFLLLADRRRDIVFGVWPLLASSVAGILYIVVPFYLKSIVSPQVKQTTLMKLSLTGPTTLALTLALILGSPIRHFLVGFKVSFLVVLVLLLETMGMGIMTAGRLNQELPMMDGHNSR